MLSTNSEKRTPMQIAGIVVIAVLALLIVCTFAIFGIFRSADSAPKLFGHRVYVVNNDRMEPRIPKGAAVFVEEGTLPSDNKVILCSIDNHLWVLGFVGTETAEDGSLRYLVKYDNATDDKTWGIAAGDIIGTAQTYDMFIGSVIRFASSKVGMLVIVIVPCMLIIAYEILMLIISGRRPAGAASPKSKEKKSAGKREEPIRRVGGGPDADDVAPAREDVQTPIDIVSDEKYVEKQLRRATNKLSSVVLETAAGTTVEEEISLEPVLTMPEEKPALKPAESAAPAVSEGEKPSILGELSASRIDELIKLLEEEKKRLGQ